MYDTPRTPYQRVMDSGSLDKQTAQDLQELYESLNPAELKRSIDKKVKSLVRAHRKKRGAEVDTHSEEELFGVIVNHLTESISVS